MQAGKLLYGYLKRYFIFQRRLLCLCSQQFHDCSLEIVVQVHSLKLGNLLQNRGVLAYHFIDCCFQIKLDLCTFQNFKNMALGLISVQAGLLRQADLDLVFCCDGRKLNNEFSFLCQIAIRKIPRPKGQTVFTAAESPFRQRSLTQISPSKCPSSTDRKFSCPA